MPEIVEIKKYCDFIKKQVLNKKVKSIKILGGRYKKHGQFEGYKDITKDLPLKLLDVKSKGKFIYFTFEDDYLNKAVEHGFFSEKAYLEIQKNAKAIFEPINKHLPLVFKKIK